MATILMVVGDKAVLTADDTPIRDRLINTHGHTVVFASDEEAEFTGAYDGIVITDSVAAATIGTKYKTVAKPGIGLDAGVWTGWSLCTVTAQHGAVTAWSIPTANEFTNNLSGVQTVYSASTTQNGLNPSNLGTGGVVRASVNGQPTNASYVTYETGALLSDGSAAPARRVGFGIRATTTAQFNAVGYQILDAAIRWAFPVPVVNTSPFFNLITM